MKEQMRDMELSEARYRTIIRTAMDGFLVVDREGRFLDVNDAYCKLIGYSRKDLIGMRIQDVEATEKPEEVIQHLRKIMAAGFDRFETRQCCGDGRILDMEVSVNYLAVDGGCFFVFLRDISERRQAEREIERVRDQAEAASRAKSEFLANMSHEIRTPMNAIVGLTHLALKTELTPKQRDYLNKIQVSAHGLLGIVNDILDFSKIEAGKLEIEAAHFHLDQLLDNVVSMMRIKAEEKDLELKLAVASDVPKSVIGDQLRLGQVLINLIGNAVKFTQQGEIEISVKAAAREGRRVRLSFAVRDTGIGMTEAERSKLYQAFSQANSSTTRKYGGTGLGLTISKRLVGLMGGEIDVESVPCRGSTFSFTVECGLKPETGRRLLAPEIQRLKILVVDDEETARSALVSMLGALSFAADAVDSGWVAITELERAVASGNRPYDLMFLDWHMPNMDGVETARHIKANKHLPWAPLIVMVSAYGREEAMRQAEELQLDGFLVKPVDSTMLLDTILHVVGWDTQKQWIFPDAPPLLQEFSALAGIKVLLVEDHDINRQVAQEILESAGITVLLANNGKEAVETVARQEVDAVLMDIQMPEMDGYTAVERIRRDLKNDVPIIAMTAYAMESEKDRCLAAGMNDHLGRPVEPERLFETLAKWVKPAMRIPDSPPPELPPPETAKSPLPRQIPGVAMDEALRRLNQNTALLAKLLWNFGADFADIVPRLRDAVAGGDFAVARQLAHTLQGTAGNLGMHEVLSHARVLERAIREQEKAQVMPAVERLEQVIRPVFQGLSCLPAPTSPGPTVSAESWHLTAALAGLENLLQRNNLAARQQLELVKSLAPDSGCRPLLSELENCLARFNFKESRRVVAKLVKTLSGDK